MIKIAGLNKSFGSRILFDDLNLNINAKEKIGLVGRNGHGKTSLFKMILNKMDYDSGSISMPKNYKLGYLEQHINFVCSNVLEEVCMALPQSQKDEQWKAEKIFFGLGFSKNDMYKNPLDFSGGYKIRINLAKVLLSDSDMLMLDEPSNYLDIVAIRWLTGFLRSWKGELMLITHDRNFMDSVVTHCAAIHRTKARKIEGTTCKLYEQIAKEEEIYEKTRLNIEKRKKKMELFIRRFRAKARLAGMVQSRIKSLEKQENFDELSKINNLDFSFSGLDFHASKMLSVYNLSFGYAKDCNLIQKLNFDVLKRERVCVIGKNGKGKSTLLKLLAERLMPSDGSIKKHPDLKTAYFVQSDSANLNPTKTVYDEIVGSNSDFLPQKARNIAGSVMFRGDDALKKIEVLSGGEKSRVLLGKILANPCHLLLLDEPTNHLDIESCESLIDAINEFSGSVIMVTHNEEILHRVATKLIIFNRNEILVFDGTYQNFLDTKGWEDEGGVLAKKTNTQIVLKKDKNEIKKVKAKLIQDRSKVLKPLEEKVKTIEKDIFDLEKELSLNTEQLLVASTEGNVVLVSESSKLNKILKSKIENLYIELDINTKKLEQESGHFTRLINELQESNINDNKVKDN
ncbi:MAG: ATP-binding cassette domain-containing protein [Endomicrobium sp.]|jgi:ATP-binding cassette subfamily F protein 3|nr:ATP-binding cassette domain-containing protein [Endomicrobium sp.]